MICSLQEGPYFGCTSNILVAPATQAMHHSADSTCTIFWTGPNIIFGLAQGFYLLLWAHPNNFWTGPIMLLGF